MTIMQPTVEKKDIFSLKNRNVHSGLMIGSVIVMKFACNGLAYRMPHPKNNQAIAPDNSAQASAIIHPLKEDEWTALSDKKTGRRRRNKPFPKNRDSIVLTPGRLLKKKTAA